jgi:hypothetical protein
LTKT